MPTIGRDSISGASREALDLTLVFRTSSVSKDSVPQVGAFVEDRIFHVAEVIQCVGADVCQAMTDAPRDPDAPGYSAYPSGPVAPGGRTDRWLTEFPNLYTDLSAGSALNALTRDRDFARDFVRRHRAKLMWATDCPCLDGRGMHRNGRTRGCFAAQSLAALRELCADQATFEDIIEHNAVRLLQLEPAANR